MFGRAPSSRASTSYNVGRKTVRCTLSVDRIVNKPYQLEEDEDAVSTTSAVFLSSDGTLSIGKTDGPTPEKVDATWKYSDSDGELLVEIERFYEEGNTKFSVKRILRGHLDDSGKYLVDLPVFSGGMYQHPADFSSNSEIGWFNMILAIDDLPSADFDISSQ
ncbi:unnamed protein product [Agarophyton chilense]